MPIRSVAAQVASLKNDYGTSRGANAPASWELAIFTSDPMTGGTEMPTTTGGVANGYARVTVANTDANFPAPDPVTGELVATAIVMPTSLAAYPATGTHWQLFAVGTGDAWDCAAFAATDRVVVTGAGAAPRPVLSIFYNELTE